MSALSDQPLPPKLVEGFVVESTCNALKRMGWTTNAVASTTTTGVDIVATRDDARLHIEAKGAGSSAVGSKRYGKPFTTNQVVQSLSAALYTALAVEAPTLSGIAVPDTPTYRARLKPGIAESLTRLGIVVFWVSEDGSVRTDNDAAIQ
jgi:hypothetical protein